MGFNQRLDEIKTMSLIKIIEGERMRGWKRMEPWDTPIFRSIGKEEEPAKKTEKE